MTSLPGVLTATNDTQEADAWAAAVRSWPLASTHNVSITNASLMNATTRVLLTSIARSEDDAFDLTWHMFDAISNGIPELQSMLTAHFGANVLQPLRADSLRAEFTHSVHGLVQLNGAIAPSPPSVRELELPTVAEALMGFDALSPEAQAETIRTVYSAVTATLSVSIGLSVATSVGASVAASVGGSVASGVAGSTAGSVAGSTAGGAGAGVGGAGGGGAGAGGVFPLILGAQRFATSSVPGGEGGLQQSVASELGWITGDLRSILGSGSDDNTEIDEASGRRLQRRGGGASDAAGDALSRLQSSLTTFAIVMPSVMLVHALLLSLFAVCANRAWYAEQHASSKTSSVGLVRLSTRRINIQAKNSERRKNQKQATRRFRPLPGILVFPSIEMLVLNFLATGLTSAAAEVVFQDTECNSESCVEMPARVTLVFVLLYVIFSVGLVLRFYFRFGREMWQPTSPPDHPREVEDPFYRWVSKMRWRICAHDRPHIVMDRARGSYDGSAQDVAEPGRTERILRRPLTLLPHNAVDSLDALRGTWLNRASSGLPGVTYDSLVLTINFVLALLSGMNNAWQARARERAMLDANATSLNSSDAISAMIEGTRDLSVVIVSLRLTLALYLAMAGPSGDRIENIVTTSQFFLEGFGEMCTLLTFNAQIEGLPTTPEEVAGLVAVGFACALLAMFLPYARGSNPGREMSC